MRQRKRMMQMVERQQQIELLVLLSEQAELLVVRVVAAVWALALQLARSSLLCPRVPLLVSERLLLRDSLFVDGAICQWTAAHQCQQTSIGLCCSSPQPASQARRLSTPTASRRCASMGRPWRRQQLCQSNAQREGQAMTALAVLRGKQIRARPAARSAQLCWAPRRAQHGAERGAHTREHSHSGDTKRRPRFERVP